MSFLLQINLRSTQGIASTYKTRLASRRAGFDLVGSAIDFLARSLNCRVKAGPSPINFHFWHVNYARFHPTTREMAHAIGVLNRACCCRLSARMRNDAMPMEEATALLWKRELQRRVTRDRSCKSAYSRSNIALRLDLFRACGGSGPQL
jgi:hypothetical protein